MKKNNNNKSKPDEKKQHFKCMIYCNNKHSTNKCYYNSKAYPNGPPYQKKRKSDYEENEQDYNRNFSSSSSSSKPQTISVVENEHWRKNKSNIAKSSSSSLSEQLLIRALVTAVSPSSR